MFDIIKSVIKNKNFELKDILYKINKMWIESAITEEQKTELDSLARENAVAENSYAPLQEQINNANTRMDELEARIVKLENSESSGETGEDTEPEEPIGPIEEYPEFVQPTGAHDCYNTGDKITYNGKKYICKMDGCVWAPDVYPAGWEEVVEETVEDTVEDTVETDTNEEG